MFSQKLNQPLEREAGALAWPFIRFDKNFKLPSFLHIIYKVDEQRCFKLQ